MNMVAVFEKLAHGVHYKNHEIIQTLPEETRNAILSSDMGYLRQQLSSSTYFANESHVVSISK